MLAATPSSRSYVGKYFLMFCSWKTLHNLTVHLTTTVLSNYFFDELEALALGKQYEII